MISMTKWLTRMTLASLSALLIVVAAATDAHASTLTFDDIGTAVIDTIPDGYGGLNWDSMGYVNGSLYVANSGYENGTVSGSYTAFNEFANVGTVDGATFDFISAYLTAAWNDGLTITATGLLAGNPLYSQSVMVNTSGPTLFNFNFVGIDQLKFSSFGGTPNPNLNGSGAHFAMDNMVINESVPDGGSALAMLGVGMVGLGAIRRKFNI